MQFLKFSHYDALSEAGAQIISDLLCSKEAPVLGLATGSTPVGMYQKLVERNHAGKIDFSRVKTVNLDEYYPIDPKNRQSYRYFMNENLFDHVNIDKQNTYVPDGSAQDPEAESRRYEQIIDSLGGMDIQVLGIGQNGHIGFNEPEEKLYLYTHKTSLTENTIEANSRFFSADEVIPAAALTMGMASIFKAKKILLLISGKNKHAALQELLSDRITTACPATLLKLHPDVVVLYDEAALQGE